MTFKFSKSSTDKENFGNKCFNANFRTIFRAFADVFEIGLNARIKITYI